MPFFDKYTALVSKVTFGGDSGEELFNLYELAKCIETDKTTQSIDDFILVPFYVCGGKRYELYQYEFYLEGLNGETLQEYILRVTGRKSIENVPADIYRIRQICFARMEEGNQSEILLKLKEYFIFLMEDEGVRKEIRGVYSEFDINKLFISIYY